MAKLSGILEYSMGNFLCLRGFASFKLLNAISEPNPEVQRELIEKHKEDIARFLNHGDYRFFPEVILSLSLTDGKNDIDLVNSFHDALRSGKTWNKRIGNFNFNISQNVTKHELNRGSAFSPFDRIKIAHIRFDEKKQKIARIDGNHRLSAADEIKDDFIAPYCLLLFRSPSENEQYSRAIFHNINAKQIPLNLEENLKVILGDPNVFIDEKLKKDESFGWKYYLSRETLKKVRFSDYPFVQALIRGSECTFLLEEFGALLQFGLLSETEDSSEQFIAHLPAIEAALMEAQLHSVPQNMAVAGAISFYKLTDAQKYAQFIPWIKKNCIADAPNIHMMDLIGIFDKVYENMPRSVFMSMQFCNETEDTYQAVKDVKDALKAKDNIDLEIIRVDEHTDGYSDEIYHRIVEGIRSSSLVIADLSYGNRNVHHEIGYAQGLGKKVLLLYHIRAGVDPKSEIGSNISMHDQLRFSNRTELRARLLKKIRQYFGVEREE